MPRRVSAIVLSNAATDRYYQFTCDCLRSLRAAGGADWNVVVVEQSPRDQYGDPRCRVIAVDAPFHYNRFLQIGWKALAPQGDVIALLNNDLIFRKGFWPPLDAALRHFDSVSPWCPGFHDVWMPPDDRPYYTGYRVPYEVTGWVILCNRSVMDRIGIENLFPDEFPAWFQDSWYAHQLERHGLTHALVAASHVVHAFGGSKRLIDPAQKARWTYAEKKVFDLMVARHST